MSSDAQQHEAQQRSGTAGAPYLSLAMIARNAGAMIDRCLASVLERDSGPMVDEVVVVLGGDSEDDTVARLEAWATTRSPVPLRVLPLDPETRARAVDEATGRLIDFAAARNASYAACRGEWILWLDADDVLSTPADVEAYVARCGTPSPTPDRPRASETLAELLRRQPSYINSVWLPYHYLIDEAGNAVVKAARDRIHRWGAGFTWTGAIHEYVVPLPGNAWRPAQTDGLFVKHLPVESSAVRSARNFTVLDRLRDRGEQDWNVAFYLGNTYHDLRDHAQAREWLRKATRLARVDAEAVQTYHALQRNARLDGAFGEAMAAAAEIIALRPDAIEGPADLVFIFGLIGRWDRCLDWYERYLKQPGRAPSDTYNAYETHLWPHLHASYGYQQAGRHIEAIEAAERACAFAPYDPDARRQLAYAREVGERARAVAAVVEIVGPLLARGDGAAAGAILDALPPEWSGEPKVRALRGALSGADRAAAEDVEAIRSAAVADGRFALDVVPANGDGGGRRWTGWRTARAVSAAGLDAVELRSDPDRVTGRAERYRTTRNGRTRTVAIFCPSFAEPWGPWTPETTGIGASEEQVILAARYLAAEGLHVTVYAPVTDLQIDAHVRYEPLEAFDHRAPRDALLLHRAPWVVRHGDLGAARTFVWIHDVPVAYGEGSFAPAVVRSIEAVLTLSGAMEQHLANLGVGAEKCRRLPYLLPAGDLGALPAEAAPRLPHKIFWGSNPYRGLGAVLSLWPEVLRYFPDAELHACYGWQVFDEVMKTDFRLAGLREQLTAGMRQAGVRWHDRLPQRAVRDLMLRCGTWWYPSTFPELYCLLGQRALAAGLIPAVRPVEALNETIPDDVGFKLTADPSRPEGLMLWRDAILTFLGRPQTDEDRARAHWYAIKRHEAACVAWSGFAASLRDGREVQSGAGAVAGHEAPEIGRIEAGGVQRPSGDAIP